MVAARVGSATLRAHDNALKATRTVPLVFATLAGPPPTARNLALELEPHLEFAQVTVRVCRAINTPQVCAFATPTTTRRLARRSAL